jgi:hypothetical protein
MIGFWAAHQTILDLKLKPPSARYCDPRIKRDEIGATIVETSDVQRLETRVGNHLVANC